MAKESLWWQNVSQEASSAEGYAWPDPFMNRTQRRNGEVIATIPARTGTPPRERNRVLEIHGLMGAIGEQFGLACTIERDIQRFVATAERRDFEHQLLIQRALGESAAYFVLGASHSLGNLVLRLLMLNEKAAVRMVAEEPKSGGFLPFTDDRNDWLTLNSRTARLLRRAGRESENEGMCQAAEATSALQRSDAFKDLEKRRGMDYHRRRPQSVQHTGLSQSDIPDMNGWIPLGITAQAEPEADADLVHRLVLDAMNVLLRAMREVRQSVPVAIRAEGINYVVDLVMGEPTITM